MQIISLTGGMQVRVSPCDETLFNGLVSYTPAIQTCMKDFVRKKGETAEEEEDDNDDEEAIV